MSAAKPRLLLHIGGQKCGSSAIQGYLFFNRRALAESGFAYVDREFGADPALADSHNAALKSVLKMPEPEFVRRFEALASRLGTGAAVFSSEGLCMVSRVERFAARFALLRRAFDVRVLFYVRNQPEIFYSGWQQWGPDLDFDAWVDRALDERRADWGLIADAWAGALGADAIQVALFRPDRFPGRDVVRDFCGRTGVPMLETRRDGDANPSVPDLTLLAMRRIAGEHGVPVQALVRHLKRTPAYRFGPKRNLVMDADAIGRIADAYRAGNDRLWERLRLPAGERAEFDRVAIAPVEPVADGELEREVDAWGRQPTFAKAVAALKTATSA